MDFFRSLLSFFDWFEDCQSLTRNRLHGAKMGSRTATP